MGDKYFLIAVCKDTVTTIGEINGDELVLTDNTKTGETFGNVFSRFKIVHKDKTEKEETDEEVT